MNSRVLSRLGFSLTIVSILMVLAIVSRGQTKVRAQKARLVISFYSICCGIDHEAKDKLDKFIRDYEAAHHRRLKMAAVHWGREGEIDYCFRLSELTPRERKSFISRTRSLLSKSKLMRIYKNVPCKSER